MGLMRCYYRVAVAGLSSNFFGLLATICELVRLLLVQLIQLVTGLSGFFPVPRYGEDKGRAVPTSFVMDITETGVAEGVLSSDLETFPRRSRARFWMPEIPLHWDGHGYAVVYRAPGRLLRIMGRNVWP